MEEMRLPWATYCLSLPAFERVSPLRPFAQESRAKDERPAQDRKGTDGFAEDEAWDQNGGQGVEVAVDGDGLGFQDLHGGKVQDIGKSGIDDGDDGKQEEASWVRAEAGQIFREKDIGEEDDARHGQLDHGGVKGRDRLQLSIDEDHRGIEHGRPGAEEESGEAGGSKGRAAEDPWHHHHAA